MANKKELMTTITFKDLTKEQQIRATVYNNMKLFLNSVDKYPLVQLKEDLLSVHGLSYQDIAQIINTMQDSGFIKITSNGLIIVSKGG